MSFNLLSVGEDSTAWESTIQWLDWASHEYVGPEFIGVTTVVLIGLLWWMFIKNEKIVTIESDDDSDSDYDDTAELSELMTKAERFKEEGKNEKSLRYFLKILKRGGVGLICSDLFTKSLHEAAVLSKEVGESQLAWKLVHVEKYYYTKLLSNYVKKTDRPEMFGKMIEMLRSALRDI